MRLIGLIIFAIVMASCSRWVCVSRVASWDVDSTQPIIDMEAKTYEGEIISDAFVNKVGTKSEDWSDYYFETTATERHFIKFTDSTFSRTKAAEFIGKPIKVEGFLREGHWDCEENLEYEVQSRIGFYLVITKVLEE